MKPVYVSDSAVKALKDLNAFSTSMKAKRGLYVFNEVFPLVDGFVQHQALKNNISPEQDKEKFASFAQDISFLILRNNMADDLVAIQLASYISNETKSAFLFLFPDVKERPDSLSDNIKDAGVAAYLLGWSRNMSQISQMKLSKLVHEDERSVELISSINRERGMQ